MARSLRNDTSDTSPPGQPTTPSAAPNEVWNADFKGQCSTGDGLYCLPLTAADGDSRFLLGCQALSATRVAAATPVCTRLFKACGVSKRLRTDHGGPLATNTLGRLSPPSAWWGCLGILPECIEPGTPQPNGRHERMHRPLQADTTRPPARPRRAQQLTCDGLREECNGQRPHEALAIHPPASHDAPSSRQMPHRLPPLNTPTASRGATSAPLGASGGTINGSTFHIPELANMSAARTLTDGLWKVSFGPLTRGRLLERHRRIEDAYGGLTRRR